MSPIAINSLTIDQITTRLKKSRENEQKNSVDRAKSSLTEEQAESVARYISTNINKDK